MGKNLLETPPGDWLAVLSILAGFSINVLVLVMSMAGSKKREIYAIRPPDGEPEITISDQLRKKSLEQELRLLRHVGSHVATSLALQMLLLVVLVSYTADIEIPRLDFGYSFAFHFLLFLMATLIAIQVRKLHALIGS